jgi:hypothetical protein
VACSVVARLCIPPVCLAIVTAQLVGVNARGASDFSHQHIVSGGPGSYGPRESAGMRLASSHQYIRSFHESSISERG